MRRGLVGATRVAVALALGLAVSSLATACSGGGSAAVKHPVERVGKPVEIGDAKAGRLSASSQRSDGSVVVVDEVDLPVAGYVAVYTDGGGAPGRRIGVSTLLKAGTSKDIRIRLSDRLKSGSTVHVMLHAEDNKNTSFDFPKDDRPITAEGRIVEAALKVTVR